MLKTLEKCCGALGRSGCNSSASPLVALGSLTELARLLPGEDARDGDWGENTDEVCEYRRLLLPGLGILVRHSPDERPLSELGDAVRQEIGCLGGSGERELCADSAWLETERSSEGHCVKPEVYLLTL
jgi:hypothetical protein